MTVLLTASQIQARVSELAAQIARDHDSAEPLVVVGVLKGACMFTADLVRALPGAVQLDFLTVSSYAGTGPSGQLTIQDPLAPVPVDGRRVLLVDDIVDTGRTLTRVQTHLRARGPAQLRTVCLLDKPSRRQVLVQVDYVGFEIPDAFVVGYGLDLDGQHRHLPDLRTL